MSKKFKYYFLKFYLSPFLTFFVACCIIVYINHRKHFMNHAGLLFFLVIGLTLLVGTAKVIVDQFLFPSEFDKLVQRKPFRDFINHGFVVGNGYLNGQVKDFQVLLGYNVDEVRDVRKLYANIVFKPKLSGHFMTEVELDAFNKKYATTPFEWSINSLDLEFNFDGPPPRTAYILEEIEEGINILKKEGFEPSTLADSYKIEKEIWDALLENS